MFGRLLKRQESGANKAVGQNQGNDVLYLTQNKKGRDFVVGDIHGHFELFEQLLKAVDFNYDTDRIISVGDSIDRGPESQRALEFLEKPWFYSIRGNHEAMLMASQAREYGIYELWMRNGGEWSDLVSEEFLNQLAKVYSDLPYAIEVETENGKVGVLHADIPPKMSWSELTRGLESSKLKDKQRQMLLWSRESYKNLRKSRENPGIVREPQINDIYRVYVGHSIVNNPCLFGNLMFIDTGAYVTGKLTAVDLNHEEVIMVQNETCV